jgi:multiple sugar transport system substrate-binding protein
MVIWSSFILDELAGLRNDVPPTCPQCGGDRSFLARNSGIVTAIKGPDGAEPSQFGEVTAFAITKDAKQDAAERFVEFMMSDGYIDWLSLAPEGKSPSAPGPGTSPASSPPPGTTSRPGSTARSRSPRSIRPTCSMSCVRAPRR